MDLRSTLSTDYLTWDNVRPCSYEVAHAAGNTRDVVPVAKRRPIRGQAPIEAVSLLQKAPADFHESAPSGPFPYVGWHCRIGEPEAPAGLPEYLWLALRGYRRHMATRDNWRWYPSPAEALTALSASCVRYGRGTTRLPRLRAG